jgi:hypothetical protein
MPPGRAAARPAGPPPGGQGPSSCATTTARPGTRTLGRCGRPIGGPACRAAGLEQVPRPYDLRHSFASLLLAGDRQPLYVARQLGHSVSVLLSTYAHLIDEYEERERIDADAEIAGALRKVGTHLVRTEAITGSLGKKSHALAGLS